MGGRLSARASRATSRREESVLSHEDSRPGQRPNHGRSGGAVITPNGTKTVVPKAGTVLVFKLRKA